MAAVYFDPIVRDHEVGPGHPEGPDRVVTVVDALAKRFGESVFRDSPGPDPRDVERALLGVHDASYVERFREACLERGRGFLDTPDCPFSPRSFEAAFATLSLSLAAADDVALGNVRRAFAAVRPPGHHARSGSAMGFCFFNTIAVVAEELRRRGAGKILIFDWDVHHGNGTQEIFWQSEQVLYLSIHRYPFYPGSGSAAEVGEGAGRGFTRNFPLPAGTDDARYLSLIENEITDVVDRFGPEIILLSAGFDAHQDDPLGGMRVTEEGFAGWTRRVVQWAEAHSGGKILSFLEGGYDRLALGNSAVAHFEALSPSGHQIHSAKEPAG